MREVDSLTVSLANGRQRDGVRVDRDGLFRADSPDMCAMRRDSKPRPALLVVLLLGLAVLVPRAAVRQPIVVLVSLDGWRWDYMDRIPAQNLRALAARGVRADGLIPSFPSKTFPNHYTLVTGLYPEHHGIVSNTMVDPGFAARFTMSSETARDSRWWGGEPIWVTSIRQGLRASSMFWPGSEAAIRDVRPSEWRPFDDRIPTADRLRQVLDWLALPPSGRPSLVTLYLSEVDHAGHGFGPDSPELSQAARRLDDAVGELESGVRALGLADQVAVVVVSDHGMSALSRSRVIFLDDYIDLAAVDVVEWTPVVELIPRNGSVEDVYRALKGRHPSLAVYKRAEIPRRLHYRDNPRIPPLIGVADDGWMITSHKRLADDDARGRMHGGDHGYDPRVKSMQGFFVAAGPGIRRNVRVAAFENVHVYDFLCGILGITPAPNDGDAKVARRFLESRD
jgi:predicted AlkP superfamily pyrophosphatase or phosphodiesterase